MKLEFDFVQHYYFLIHNANSLNVEDTNRKMLLLVLFKLLLKQLRLLCDRSQNNFNLSDWDEFKDSKAYQQLYSDLALHSEKYEQEYLEFIKGNDIKVIRTVNRKFP